MKALPLLTAAIALLVVSALTVHAETVTDASPGVRAELLVELRRDAPVQDRAAVHSSVGATLIRSFAAVGWDLVRLPEGMSVSEGLARYRSHSDVLAVEPNRPIHLAPPLLRADSEAAEPRFRATSTIGVVTPNDPRWSSQWNLRKIGMPAAWAVTTGDSNVVVAILDSGVDYNHEDLRDSMWRNPGESGLDSNGQNKSANGVDDDENGYVDDLYGIDSIDNDSDPMDPGTRSPGDRTPFYHGTGCAGILAARGNNGRGLAGVAWDVKIMAIRIAAGFEFTGSLGTRTAAVVEAFEYVLEQKRRGVNVRVTSNSWGMAVQSQASHDIIEMIGKEDILSVFGTGNEAISSDVSWGAPENYDLAGILSVAATDSSDRLATFSSYGPFTVDFAAPGDSIPTTSRGGYYSGTEFRGVSAAVLHAAGAAALLFSVKPDASALEVKAALMQSTDRLDSLRGKVATGGRLNVSRALQVITNNSLPVIVLGAFPASSHTEASAEIELWFSAPMNRESVERALVFSPEIPGLIQWTEDSRIVRLKPATNLMRTNYSARLLGNATDQKGQALDGDFNGLSEGAGADEFIWGFSLRPENDNFADAMPLEGFTGTIRGNTSNASFEPNEPLPNQTNLLAALTLWYQWRAPQDGWITFDTSVSSQLDTVVAAYVGSSLETLHQLGYGDAWGARQRGRVSLSVRAGTNYFITVTGRSVISDSYRGPFTLSWYPTPAPTLTATQFNPKTAMPGATMTLFGTNFTGATEVLFNGARAEFTPGFSNNSDLRIVATIPPDASDGPITIRTPHGDVTSTTNFVVLPPRLTIATINPGPIELSWPATGPQFALETTDDLLNAQWSAIDTELERKNGHTLLRPITTAPTRFYRLRKEPLP